MHKRFNALLLFIAFCMLFQMSVASGFDFFFSKGGIKGSVVNIDNISYMIEGVKITVEETEESCVTDQFGEFRFKKIPSGTYTLSLKKTGYLPKTEKIVVKSGEITTCNIKLQEYIQILSVKKWTDKTAVRLRGLLAKQGLRERKIAIAYYLKAGSHKCELPELVLRFATAFNALLREDGNEIVIRNLDQANYLIKELREQNQFRVDFDPSTVAQIGKKVGADVIVIGAIVEKLRYFEPLVNATSVEKQTYIPGVSLDDLFMQKNEVQCN